MTMEYDEIARRAQRAEERRRREEQRQEAQKKMMFRLAVVGAALILCAIVILVVALGRRGDSGETQPSETQGQLSTTVPAVTEPTTVIHLAAAGDLNVTDGTVAAGNRNGIYDYSGVFLDVAPILGAADLTVLNFEGNLYGAPYGSQNVSAPQQMVQALADAGVDLVQMANSWSIKNGISGLQATLQGIRVTGMEPLGAFGSQEEFDSSKGYYIRNIGGIRIAFVAFTKGMDNMGLPAGCEDYVNLLYKDYSSSYTTVDTEGITSILRSVAEDEPDLTVALVHWGSEYNENISSTQEKIVKLMAQEGVDAILGSHSHRLQKMGFDEKLGIFVAYSLGDLFGDASMPAAAYSIILDLEITKDNQTGKTAITGYDYTPIYTIRDPESGLPVKVLRIRQAIIAYEQYFVGRVDETTYTGMKTALTRIEERIQGK